MWRVGLEWCGVGLPPSVLIHALMCWYRWRRLLLCYKPTRQRKMPLRKSAAWLILLPRPQPEDHVPCWIGKTGKTARLNIALDIKLFFMQCILDLFSICISLFHHFRVQKKTRCGERLSTLTPDKDSLWTITHKWREWEMDDNLNIYSLEYFKKSYIW